MQEAKKDLRKKMRAHMSTLTEEYLRESNEKIFEALISREEYKKADKIFMYYSVGREADTTAILRHAFEAGKTVALPKITEKGIMVPMVAESEDELYTDKYGIPAPKNGRILEAGEIDLVIVPGVAFTADGQRLGRGGGYYDRFLSKCGAFKIAIARKYMILENLPVSQLDMPVDLVITD